MSVVLEGTVLRFDHVKGYGFIAGKQGGEDVFLHANDLLDDKYLVRPGSTVTFVLENGEKGPKASSVQLIDPPRNLGAPINSHLHAVLPAAIQNKVAPAPSAPLADVGQDDLVDVVTAHEFRHEITEVLLMVEPAIGADQIRVIRERIGNLCERHGWVEG